MAPRFVTLSILCALVAACGIGATNAAAGPASNLLAPAGVCGPAADLLSLDLSTARQSMLCLTNYARIHSGLKRLVANAMLDQAGEAKLDADVSCGEFSHTPCNRRFEALFEDYLSGARGYALGENIAFGTGSFGTPRQTMNGWLHSSEHRQNILNPAFHELGIGYLAGQAFQGVTGATLWSQEFGARSHPARRGSTSKQR